MTRYFKYGLCLLIWGLPLCRPLSAFAEPKVKAGPYEIHLIGIARQLDLTPTDQPAATTALTLTIKASPEAMEKLLEVAQEPTATVDTGETLTFQEIHFPNDAMVTPGRREFQVLLTPAPVTARGLKQFTAHLQCFDKKESLRLDFLCVAGEKLASQNLDYLVISPELLGPQNLGKGKGKLYLVKVAVQSPDKRPDPTVSWRNEQVELIDTDGQPRRALSTSRSFKYDDQGEMTTMIMTASFALPAQPPRGLRYRVERLLGMQDFSYTFEDLPLP
jgi:hypothetical protein